MALAVGSASPAIRALGAPVVASVSRKKTVSIMAASLTKNCGMKTSHRRVTSMAKYNITITDRKGTTETFTVSDGDTTILVAATKPKDIQALSYACRKGTCGKCAGKLDEDGIGKVVQKNAYRLSLKDKADGWVLTCIAIPSSDISLRSDVGAPSMPRVSDPECSSRKPNAQPVAKRNNFAETVTYWTSWMKR